jgi:hypothetical protein
MENLECDEIKIPYDKLYDFKKFDVMEAKFNIMAMMQMKAYENSKYKPEEKIVIQNEKGVDESKEIPLTNYIRWRYENNSNDDITDNVSNVNELDEALGIKNIPANNLNKKIESNAKIVEWSDSTFQLLIGDEYFDIMFSNMDNVRFGIDSKDTNITIVNKPVKQRIILTPSEYTKSMRQKEKIINHNENAQKVKVAYSYYDKQAYNKDEFSTKFGKKKQNNPLQRPKEASEISKAISRKRKRSGDS